MIILQGFKFYINLFGTGVLLDVATSTDVVWPETSGWTHAHGSLNRQRQ